MITAAHPYNSNDPCALSMTQITLLVPITLMKTRYADLLEVGEEDIAAEEGAKALFEEE